MKNKYRNSRYSVTLLKDTINPDFSKFRILDYGVFIGWLHLDGSVWDTSNSKLLNLPPKEIFQIRTCATHSKNTRTILHYWANKGLF